MSHAHRRGEAGPTLDIDCFAGLNTAGVGAHTVAGGQSVIGHGATAHGGRGSDILLWSGSFHLDNMKTIQSIIDVAYEYWAGDVNAP